MQEAEHLSGTEMLGASHRQSRHPVTAASRRRLSGDTGQGRWIVEWQLPDRYYTPPANSDGVYSNVGAAPGLLTVQSSVQRRGQEVRRRRKLLLGCKNSDHRMASKSICMCAKAHSSVTIMTHSSKVGRRLNGVYSDRFLQE